MKALHSLLAVLALVCVVSTASAATTELTTIGSAGEPANGRVYQASAVQISADGRYVAFASWASNLMPGGNATMGIFVRDRQLGLTEVISVSSGGQEIGGITADCAISGDGMFVAFASWVTSVVPGDMNGTCDYFFRDRAMGTTTMVSLTNSGEQENGESGWCAAVNADGRYVAFESDASNLVEGDTNGVMDVFVRDRELGVTERVSVSSSGAQANGESGIHRGSAGIAISADGRYVAFTSSASDLVDDDTNGVSDVFVHDRQTGITERVSVTTGRTQADGSSGGVVAVSADGRYVTFPSSATNLVPDDTNGVQDVFVHDRQAATTERVSVGDTGEQADGGSGTYLAASADARYVVFTSSAANLVAGDTNGAVDVFLRDRAAGRTQRVNLSVAGEEANDSSDGYVSVSADGNYVSYCSAASNLVPGDTNGVWDAFVCDRGATGFWDVPPDFWAYNEIMACANAGIVQGYPDGSYRPTSPVTRDQMAVYISRALVIPSGDEAIPDPEPPPSFTDVAADHWAYRWIEYAASHSIVQGYPGGGYHPDEVVNRGQMAVYVARAVAGGDAAVPADTDGASFTDVAETGDWGWCYRYVEYCAANGIVQGYADDTYRPVNEVTRDQMAVYVARAFALEM